LSSLFLFPKGEKNKIKKKKNSAMRYIGENCARTPPPPLPQAKAQEKGKVNTV
jgi:hypothetical protein